MKIDIEAQKSHGSKHLVLVPQQGIELTRDPRLDRSRGVVGVADATAPGGEVKQSHGPEAGVHGEVVLRVVAGLLSMTILRAVSPLTFRLPTKCNYFKI